MHLYTIYYLSLFFFAKTSYVLNQFLAFTTFLIPLFVTDFFGTPFRFVSCTAVDNEIKLTIQDLETDDTSQKIKNKKIVSRCHVFQISYNRK